jgi:hypothetical protein
LAWKRAKWREGKMAKRQDGNFSNLQMKGVEIFMGLSPGISETSKVLLEIDK